MRRMFHFSYSCFLSLWLQCFLLPTPLVGAFVLTVPVGGLTLANRQSIWRIHSDINPSLDGDDFDFDSAREKLQSMFQEDADATTSSNSGAINERDNFDILKYIKQAASQSNKDRTPGIPMALDDDTIPSLPPLSTIERDRRQVEITLLQQLASSESMKELWDLWYSERGGLALARLQQADQLMGDPTSWKDCETSLLQLIQEYSIYFVEPVNRLATLYYLQGKYEESYQLCRLILLKLKPWHVGALAGMVQVCINKGDREEARYWASRRLPSSVAGSSFPPFEASNGPLNPRRAEWVQDMVQVAKKMLKNSENTTKQRLGEPEGYYSNQIRAENVDPDNSWEEKFEGDVWQ